MMQDPILLGDPLRPAPTKPMVSFIIPKNKLSGALVPKGKPTGRWEPIEPKKEEEPPKPTRKTRWGHDPTQDPLVRKGRALALQTRSEQIAAQLELNNLEIDPDTRSPSPPPIYDAQGQRTNTREGRKREALELERREAIGEVVKLNPSFKPPAGWKPLLKEAKLFIPMKDYPGYNFIGLILGPRGNTQKRMEQETGAKIAIRGKGAVKEGKIALRRDGREAEGANEDLHVHICADTIEKVDAAVSLVEPLLTPVDETRNQHKRKQLRELAEMNGTMRTFPTACALCGESGHRDWQCPNEKLVTFHAKVSCNICGDGGHPTIDCPRRLQTGPGGGQQLEKEFKSFMDELGGGLGGGGGGALPTLPTGVFPRREERPVGLGRGAPLVPGQAPGLMAPFSSGAPARPAHLRPYFPAGQLPGVSGVELRAGNPWVMAVPLPTAETADEEDIKRFAEDDASAGGLLPRPPVSLGSSSRMPLASHNQALPGQPHPSAPIRFSPSDTLGPLAASLGLMSQPPQTGAPGNPQLGQPQLQGLHMMGQMGQQPPPPSQPLPPSGPQSWRAGPPSSAGPSSAPTPPWEQQQQQQQQQPPQQPPQHSQLPPWQQLPPPQQQGNHNFGPPMPMQHLQPHPSSSGPPAPGPAFRSSWQEHPQGPHPWQQQQQQQQHLPPPSTSMAPRPFEPRPPSAPLPWGQQAQNAPRHMPPGPSQQAPPWQSSFQGGPPLPYSQGGPPQPMPPPLPPMPQQSWRPPLPPLPSGSSVDVDDAEYEKLMASVGLT